MMPKSTDHSNKLFLSWTKHSLQGSIQYEKLQPQSLTLPSRTPTCRLIWQTSINPKLADWAQFLSFKPLVNTLQRANSLTSETR